VDTYALYPPPKDLTRLDLVSLGKASRLSKRLLLAQIAALRRMLMTGIYGPALLT